MMIQLSVCMCTRNRPDYLRRLLESIQAQTIPAMELIVSDDSTDTRTKEMLQQHFPDVVYTEGPRRGVGANRNHALQFASGTHLLFPDDDSELCSDFIELANTLLGNLEPAARDKTIVSGIVYEHGVDQIYPKDQSFLGYQTISYDRSERLNTFVLGSTIFPMEVFDKLRFDEQLVYGYEEVDFSSRAARNGYNIVLNDHVYMNHYSSPANRDYYKPVIEASRFYVTFKRYAYTDKQLLKGYAFYMLASVHMMLSDLKNKGIHGLKDALRTVKLSQTYIRNYRNSRAAEL
ncbi:glycosyltransferase family 2 protein [Paenibacillus sp. NEAU-GSW1]|uniref:glycosyltransferase family 2 protein n=1 Tax=Paenibacillus sp. NEAU-GSW1 TaxID=2682486 RepID=UPI0012E22EE8|nr:glycosyltransferase family 2 protein [Paenibacillus sp. NEAU-GSW1]MUT68054.1 glycosyltransferase [Paenibacillus sp. NEAU-GSW1]